MIAELRAAADRLDELAVLGLARGGALVQGDAARLLRKTAEAARRHPAPPIAPWILEACARAVEHELLPKAEELEGLAAELRGSAKDLEAAA